MMQTAPNLNESRLQSADRPTTIPHETRRIDSDTLMAGQNLLMIEHAGSSYFLRMTRNNKLILTK